MTLERTTVHINDDTGRVAMYDKRTSGSDSFASSTVRYIYSNHLSTASLELDDSAAIISYEEYHPYGTSSFRSSNASINAIAKRYRYTGKERDEETGLYYIGARYYCPWLARWCAVDPLDNEYAPASPYNYSLNNPIKLVDRDGKGVEVSNIRNIPSEDNKKTVQNPYGGDPLTVSRYVDINATLYLYSGESNVNTDNYIIAKIKGLTNRNLNCLFSERQTY